jgi:hypothetical protein
MSSFVGWLSSGDYLLHLIVSLRRISKLAEEPIYRARRRFIGLLLLM